MFILFCSYLSPEEHAEFERFLHLKLVYAVQMRHIRDHVELTQLQLRILDELKGV
jgi:hypothetical protein